MNNDFNEVKKINPLFKGSPSNISNSYSAKLLSHDLRKDNSFKYRQYLLKIAESSREEYNLEKAISAYTFLLISEQRLLNNKAELTFFATCTYGLAEMKMQAGLTKGKYGAINLSKSAFSLYKEIDDKLMMSESLRMLALSHKTSQNYVTASKFFNESINLLISIDKKSCLKFNLGHTLMDLATSQNRIKNYSETHIDKLFTKSRDLFFDSSESFSIYNQIRYAEHLLNSGRLNLAYEIINKHMHLLEPDTNRQVLTKPMISVYLRIIVALLAKLGDATEATKYYIKTYSFNQKECYLHQEKNLKKLHEIFPNFFECSVTAS